MKEIKFIGVISMLTVLCMLLVIIILFKLGLTIVQICMVYAGYLLIDKWISKKRP